MAGRLWTGVLWIPSVLTRRLAWEEGRKRWRSKEAVGIADMKMHSNPKLIDTVHSILLEMACVEILGIDRDTTARPGGQKKGNLIWPDGRRGFVKYRSIKGQDFAMDDDTMDGFMGDIGILGYPSEQGKLPSRHDGVGIEVYGWVSRDDFIERRSRRSFRTKDEKGWMVDNWRIVVAPTKMRRMSELLHGIVEQEGLGMEIEEAPEPVPLIDLGGIDDMSRQVRNKPKKE